MKNYRHGKKGGLIELKKVNDAYALFIKRFDPNTGEKLEEDIQAIDVDELRDHISELEKELDDCYQLIEDILYI